MTTTSESIEQALWELCDYFRSTAPISDIVTEHVLPLLLLKKLSDEAMRNTDSVWPKHAGATKLRVPEAACWSRIIDSTSEPNARVDSAFAALAAVNEQWSHFFESFARNRPHHFRLSNDINGILRHAFTRLSQLDLDTPSLEHPDAAGEAIRHLLQRLMEQNRYGEEYHSPSSILDLLASLADPEQEMSIADTMSGAAGALIACGLKVRRKESLEAWNANRSVRLFGQERNMATWKLAHLNLFLSGFDDFRIELGDTLSDPRLEENLRLMQFDRVVSVPPFGVQHQMKLEHDLFGRFRYGIPNRAVADFLVLQHALSILKPGGKAVVLLAAGAASRGGSEQDIRGAMLRDDVIEAVIELPANLFFGTSIATMVWILNPDKEHRGRVLLIRCPEQAQDSSARAKLSDNQIDMIADIYRAFEERNGLSRVVTYDELASQDFVITPSRYIDTFRPPEPMDIGAAMIELRELNAQWQQTAARLDALLDSFTNPLPDAPQ